MRTWEYRVRDLPSPSQYKTSEQQVWALDLESALDELGRDGWELQGFINQYAVFKRYAERVAELYWQRVEAGGENVEMDTG